MIETQLKTSEVLDLAADKIEENGWRTGGGWFPEQHYDQRICLEGGIVAALGLTPETLDLDDEDDWSSLQTCPAYVAVKSHIGTSGALWSWNDRQTSKEPVLAALRGAAEAERQKEQQ